MNQVKPYSHFSLIYSYLMGSVDYKFWAKYIKEIHNTLGQGSDIALELAAGNCSLAKYLNKHFYKLYVSDISVEMLKQSNDDLNKVCCDMTMLPFNNKFDFIYSTFDSVNYLNSTKKLNKYFANIKNSMNLDAILLFDISLEKNSLEHVKKLNRKGKYKNIEYIQKSEYIEDEKIHYNYITFILPNGKIINETHKQKIFDFYYYFEVLENNSFYVVECFDAFTFDDATENSERIQFIVRRKT